MQYKVSRRFFEHLEIGRKIERKKGFRDSKEEGKKKKKRKKERKEKKKCLKKGKK